MSPGGTQVDVIDSRSRTETTMRNERTRGRRVAGLLTVGLSVVAAACGGEAEANGAAEQEAGADEFARVVNVEVRAVTPRSFVEQIRLTGAVRADRDVQVSAEETGVVEEVLAEKGRWVEAGAPLVRLNADVLSAQARQARAQSELARQTWERRRQLYEEDQVGSELSYLEARFEAEQAEAALNSLEERLARTVVRAPFSGFLEDRMVEVGTRVSPGQPVARLVDRTPVKIVAGVPERYAADVSVGAEAVVTFDVFPGDVFRAPITYVGSTVDPQNRTFPVEVRMPNPQGVIKPEMVANVAVERRSLEDAIVVPQDALVRVENGYVVFVVTERGGNTVAEARRVELGPSQRDLAVVESGLEPGDRIIVRGQKSVAGGDRVNVVADGEDA